MSGTPVLLTSSTNVIASENTYSSNNEKSIIGGKISGITNGINNISLPQLYPQNTHSDNILIKIEGLKSSITNIASFHTTGLSFSKDLSEKLLASNPDKVTTHGQSKLNSIKLGTKVEIPKISDEQQTILSNNKINSKIINDQAKEKSEDNNKSNIEYEKIQNRYELNSNKFSDVKKFIENKTATDQEKKNKIKKYLKNNDLSMKKIGKFERFKNIFGLSNKINWILREQRTDALNIFNNLKENSENINKK